MAAYLVLAEEKVQTLQAVSTEADIVGSFAHFVGTVRNLREMAVEAVELAVPIVETIVVQVVTIENTVLLSLAVNENHEDHWNTVDNSLYSLS